MEINMEFIQVYCHTPPPGPVDLSGLEGPSTP